MFSRCTSPDFFPEKALAVEEKPSHAAVPDTEHEECGTLWNVLSLSLTILCASLTRLPFTCFHFQLRS